MPSPTDILENPFRRLLSGARIPLGTWLMSGSPAIAEAMGRAAILDLCARHNRAYSDGDRNRWLATFRHSGATYTRDGEVFKDLRSAFDGGERQRLVTLDHEIRIDGVNAVQRCVAVLFETIYGDTTVRATGLSCTPQSRMRNSGETMILSSRATGRRVWKLGPVSAT